MYELERLAQDIPFKVLNQLGDSVGVGPGFAPVVAGSQSVGVVCLIEKGAVGFEEPWLGFTPEMEACKKPFKGYSLIRTIIPSVNG
jgi:hypothetical protein